MPVKVQCSGCNKSFQAKDSLAGKRVKCPECQQIIEIPAIEDSDDELRLEPLENQSAIPDPEPFSNGALSGREARLDAADNALHAKLLGALAENQLKEMASVLQGFNLWMISVSDGDDLEPLIGGYDDIDALVVFTSQEFLQHFVNVNPEFVQADGSVNTFAVRGPSVFEQLNGELGMLFDPESPHATMIDASCVTTIQTHLSNPQLELPSVEISLPEQVEEILHGQGDPKAAALRKSVLSQLNGMGFHPAQWLPLPEMDRQLRPQPEIAGRLLGLACVFAWASAPNDVIPGTQLNAFLKRYRLGRFITSDEREIVKLPRQQANAEHSGTVGWRTENMWPLAWVLGYDRKPDLEASQISQEIISSLLFDFIGGFDESGGKAVLKNEVRSCDEVNALEDFFYCAHNAVRSAQFGSAPNSSVPVGFDPVGHGGVVHERRHSLTWCLSPGVAWDDTDLST